MIDITIDTREQTPFHFDECFTKTRIGTVKTGDYALTGDRGFAIERKSVDDFVGTIGSDWERFKRELYRAKDAGFPSFPIIVEGQFADVLYHQDDKGEIHTPNHNHPKMTPSLILKRIGQITQLGGVVVFAGGVNEAMMITYACLHARHEDLHKDDADEFPRQEDNRKG